MLIDYDKMKRYIYRDEPTGVKYYCCKCGGKLDYCYLENRVYSIRCEDCQTHTLVKVGSPGEALAKVGEM